MEKSVRFKDFPYLAILKFATRVIDIRLVQTLSIFILLFIGFIGKSQAQTAQARIHPNDLANSNDFKDSQGRDRIAIFNQLENLIKPASNFTGPAPDYEYFIGDYKVSATDLVLLLGEPDEKIAPTIWQYYLHPNQRCKVVIGIDSESMVSYLVVKDCL